MSAATQERCRIELTRERISSLLLCFVVVHRAVLVVVDLVRRLVSLSRGRTASINLFRTCRRALATHSRVHDVLDLVYEVAHDVYCPLRFGGRERETEVHSRACQPLRVLLSASTSSRKFSSLFFRTLRQLGCAAGRAFTLSLKTRSSRQQETDSQRQLGSTRERLLARPLGERRGIKRGCSETGSSPRDQRV